MTSVDDLLFIGTRGQVCALRKTRGERVWSTSLPDAGEDAVTLLYEDGVLYAASRGLLFALSALTGEILWSNELAGLGSGHVVLATTRSSTKELVTVHPTPGASGKSGGRRRS